MRVEVSAGALSEALARIAPAADNRPAVAIYSNVLISAGGKALTLETFDGHLSARTQIEADVIEAGEITCSLATLRRWLKSVEDRVKLNVKGNDLNASASRPQPRRMKLATLPATDFYTQDFTGGERCGNLAKLGPIVKAVAGASASTKDARSYLQGVYFGPVAMVATDGNRMHHWRTPDNAATAIMARQYCALIADIPATEKDELYIANDFWRVKAGALEYKGPTLVGTYPAWEKVVDAEETTPALTVHKGDLVDAINAAALGSRGPVILEVQAGENEGEHFLNVQSAGGADVKGGFDGTASASCVAFDVENTAFRAAIHSRLLLDALAAFTTDELRLAASDGQPPRVSISAADGKSNDKLNALVMGMRY